MADQEQPSQPAPEKPRNYRRTSGEIYPLPTFITRVLPDELEELKRQAQEQLRGAELTTNDP